MQTIYPFLRYQDAAAAIAWLVEAFGCERHAVHEAPDGTIAHAELRLGDDIFMLGSAKDDFLGMKTPRQLGAVNQGLYVVVEDPDAHHARAATSKGTSGASVPTGRRCRRCRCFNLRLINPASSFGRTPSRARFTY